jgi:hypothetical protein
MRTAGALLLAPGGLQRYPWFQTDIGGDRSLRTHRIQHEEQGQSFVADVVFGGVLQQMVVNYPATMTILGDLIRRIPFRCKWRPRGNRGMTVVSADRAGRNEDSLAARALTKRTTYRYSNSQLREIIIEEFEQI